MSTDIPINYSRLQFWKPIPHYPEYWVSTYGQVLSTKRKSPVLLTSNLSTHGYYRVNLTRGKIMKTVYVHQLVLRAFLGYSDLQVNHIDGIKTNNHISNLEYVTQSENMKHAFRIGLKTVTGENNPRCKLTKSQVLQIREIYLEGDMSKKELSVRYGVTQENIQRIIKRRTWKHI